MTGPVTVVADDADPGSAPWRDVSSASPATGSTAFSAGPRGCGPAAALFPHISLILESLSFTRSAFENYRYPTYEGRQQRLADVNAALAAVRALRDEIKKGTT